MILFRGGNTLGFVVVLWSWTLLYIFIRIARAVGRSLGLTTTEEELPFFLFRFLISYSDIFIRLSNSYLELIFQ